MQYGFVIDHRKCIGCHACTVACKSENDVPVGSFRTWVKYTEIGSFPSVRRHFAVLRCNHCTSAPCVTICPVNALDKRPDGIVDLDRDACIGCKACLQACPYDALYINDETGSAEKCHYCAHRVEQGLKPACEVVCPEEAIVSGDLHDPRSEISRLAAKPDAVVRRPEQRTSPNVHYLGMDPVSLNPGMAEEPATYLWSERRLPPPDFPDGSQYHFERRADARTVLGVDHDVHWGWKVSSYLVTKGIAAGAALFAPFLGMLGVTGFAAEYLPEVLALVFTTITVALLVADLKRPAKFLRLLTRPNPKSWLFKGALVLIGFSGLTAAILVARLLGAGALADGLRWANLAFALGTATYTAFLFAQCEGRDLWQDPGMLCWQLSAQALLLGAVCLLPAVSADSDALMVLVAASLVGASIHAVAAVFEHRTHHPTQNGSQAAVLLPIVPAFRDLPLSAYRLGLGLSTAAAVVLVATAVLGGLSTAVWPALVGAACGVFLYEQAFVRAGQLPPLS